MEGPWANTSSILMEKPHRPVDLPLLKIRLPIGGIISIIHRITGVLLVLLLPLATWWLDRSLVSAQGFAEVSEMLGHPGSKLIVLLLAAILIQHLLSGIRHLLLDLHIGIDRVGARRTAWLVPMVSTVLIIITTLVLFT